MPLANYYLFTNLRKKDLSIYKTLQYSNLPNKWVGTNRGITYFAAKSLLFHINVRGDRWNVQNKPGSEKFIVTMQKLSKQ